MMKKPKKKIANLLTGILILTGPASLVALKVAENFPAQVEKYYAGVVFPAVTGFTTFFSGKTSFALIEILLFICMAVAPLWLFHNLFALVFKEKKGRRFAHMVLTLCTVASLLFAWYNIAFSMAFYREPVAGNLGLSVPERITAEQLEDTAMVLAKNINSICDEISFDERGTALFPSTIEAEMEKVFAAYNEKAIKYSVLSGKAFLLKQFSASEMLSKMFVTGFYSPFTGEAVINNRFQAFYIPFTAAHELSHQRGFSREDEANFLAFFTLQDSPEPFIRYSANMSALLYVMNALSSADTAAVDRVFAVLDSRAIEEYRQYNKFLAGYYGIAQEISEKVNDTYLKTYGQKDGIKSYDRVVVLLVALRLSGGMASY